MRVKKRIGIVVAGVAALLASAPAVQAGVVIVTESEEPQSGVAQGGKAARSATRTQGRLLVEGDDVRLEGTHTDAEGTSKGAVLFRAASDTLVVIDDHERSYFEITRADAKRLGSAIGAARGQMQAQLEKLPPEQRAMLEQAMGGLVGEPQGGAAPAGPMTAVATGGSDEVAGRSCREYDLKQGGRNVGRACVASWATLGLAASDLAGLRKLAALQRELADAVQWPGLDAAPGSEAFELMDQLGGFPVRVRTTHDGQTIVMRVVDIERRELARETFRVPEGYTKGTMPG